MIFLCFATATYMTICIFSMISKMSRYDPDPEQIGTLDQDRKKIITDPQH
jgi:hypothetical protein